MHRTNMYADLFTPDKAKEEWQVLKEEFEAKKSICIALRKIESAPIIIKCTSF